MLKRPHYIALGLVVLLTLLVLNLPSQTAARFRLGIGSLFLPLFGLAASTQQVTDAAGDAALPRRELLRLNEGLRRRINNCGCKHCRRRKQPARMPGYVSS